MTAAEQLPKGWRSMPLKRAVSLNPEVLPENTSADCELDYIDISAVNGDSTAEMSPKRMTFSIAPSRARRVLRAGDTIVSTVRTYLKAVANFPEVPSNLVASTGFAVLRPNGTLLPRFAYWVAMSEHFVAAVVAHSEGVSYPAISPSTLGTLHVPVPPVHVQERIANFLDEQTARIDALIAEKEELLTLLEEYWASVLFGTMSRAQAVGKQQLRRALRSLTQGWSPVGEAFPAADTEWGVLKLSAIKQGKFIPGENKALPPHLQMPLEARIRKGDILLTRANTPELVGGVAYVERDDYRLIASDLIYILRVDESVLDPHFLVFYLQSPQARAAIEVDARGSSQSMVKISQEHIRAWCVPDLPLPAQKAIVCELEATKSRVQQLSEHVGAHIERLREYRSSLISAAVTGQLDLGAFEAETRKAA